MQREEDSTSRTRPAAARLTAEAERQRYQELFDFAQTATWSLTLTALSRRPTELPPSCWACRNRICLISPDWLYR